MKRTWVKLFCNQWLNGSARNDPLEVRALWVDLLAIAGEFGGDGRVRITENIPFSDENIAKIMRVRLSIWRKVKLYLIENGRISVDNDGFLTIAKWTTYQSEYQRTKDAPSRKSTPESTAKSTAKSTTLEVEVRSKKLEGDIKRYSPYGEPQADQSPKNEAILPSRKNGRTKPIKTPKIIPASVSAFRDAALSFPRTPLWKRIDHVVGTEPEALARWKNTVVAWIGCGWRPDNVTGMLDFFQRHEIPPGKQGKEAPHEVNSGRHQQGPDYTEFG